MNDQRKLTYGLFGVYFIVLTWIILFKLHFSLATLPHVRGVNLIPFAGSIYKNNRLETGEILLNLLVFIPFGLYLSMIKPNGSFLKKVIAIAGVSSLFELIQFVFSIGRTDTTDILNNTLGGIVGIGIYVLLSKLLKDKTHKILNVSALIGTVSIVILGWLVSRVVIFKFGS